MCGICTIGASASAGGVDLCTFHGLQHHKQVIQVVRRSDGREQGPKGKTKTDQEKMCTRDAGSKTSCTVDLSERSMSATNNISRMSAQGHGFMHSVQIGYFQEPCLSLCDTCGVL
jgi:hypothetical protein